MWSHSPSASDRPRFRWAPTNPCYPASHCWLCPRPIHGSLAGALLVPAHHGRASTITATIDSTPLDSCPSPLPSVIIKHQPITTPLNHSHVCRPAKLLDASLCWLCLLSHLLLTIRVSLQRLLGPLLPPEAEPTATHRIALHRIDRRNPPATTTSISTVRLTLVSPLHAFSHSSPRGTAHEPTPTTTPSHPGFDFTLRPR